MATDPLRPVAARAYRHHLARARADGAALDYGAEHLLVLLQGTPLCTYCDCRLHQSNVQIDHKRPTSRSGRHELRNLAACCRGCNLVKGRLTDEEYRELLALLRSWAPPAGADVLDRLKAGGARLGGLYREGRRGRGDR